MPLPTSGGEWERGHSGLDIPGTPAFTFNGTRKRPTRLSRAPRKTTRQDPRTRPQQNYRDGHDDKRLDRS